MEKELPLSPRLVIEPVCSFIGADMTVEEKYLTSLHFRITFLQADPTFPNRFDLAPEKRNSRFECFKEFVVEIGFFILGDNLCLRLFSHNRGISIPQKGAWIERLVLKRKN
jgi:hypothetical protein